MMLQDLLLIAPEIWVLTMTCVILFVDAFIKEERRGIVHPVADHDYAVAPGLQFPNPIQLVLGGLPPVQPIESKRQILVTPGLRREGELHHTGQENDDRNPPEKVPAIILSPSFDVQSPHRSEPSTPYNGPALGINPSRNQVDWIKIITEMETIMHRNPRLLSFVLFASLALAGGQGAAAEAQTADTASGGDKCCFTNPRYSGVCQVTPGADETCGSILSYLNNPNSMGKGYCGNTNIRGGWGQVACETSASNGGQCTSETPAQVE